MTPEAFQAQLIVRKLPQDFDPGAFCCERKEIDNYLHDGTAWDDEQLWFGRTYVVLDGRDETRCVGYFTLLTDAIRLDLTEAKNVGSRYHSAPALKLARIGACKSCPGLGVGRKIFAVVLDLALEMAVDTAIRYITVDAIADPELIAKYKRWGFIENDGEQAARELEIPFDENDGERVVSMRFDIMNTNPISISAEHQAESATSII